MDAAGPASYQLLPGGEPRHQRGAAARAEKQRAQQLLGESYGYTRRFTGRFTSKLLWKEILSFCNAMSPSGSSTFQGRRWLQIRATATIHFDSRLRRGGGDLG
jgi:hypothetical protein